MIAEICIFVIALTISYFAWQRAQAYNMRGRMGLKGPTVSFLFGNLRDIRKYRKHHDLTLQILSDWRKTYGNVYGYYLGPKLVVFMADLEMAKEVLIKRFDCFVDRLQFPLPERHPMTDNLLVLKGEKWKRIRALITPTFTSSKIKQMSATVNEKVNTFLTRIGKHAISGESFDIYDTFQALTLDVIGQCAFAMQVNCQTDKNDPFLVHAQKFFQAVDAANFKLQQYAFVLPELRHILSKFGPLTSAGQLQRWLINSMQKVVEERKLRFKVHESVDVLQLLLEQQLIEEDDNKHDNHKKWKLNDDAIVANVIIFLLAGYETTSTALGFTAWLLAKHEHVQNKLHDEIDHKLQNGDVVDYDFIHKLPYLDAVFRESLRILPPVAHFVQRTCVKECYVGNLRFVPGVQVNIPVRDIHLDPDVWSDPLTFEPERFLNNAYPVMTWLPFGTGPRNCIGMRFAEMEYKIALVRLMSEFSLKFGPDSEDPLRVYESSALQRPKNGVRIRIMKKPKIF